MTRADWEAATFEGARRATARAVAGTTAQQRMEWLDAALELTVASGVLAKDRRRRQDLADALWSAGA